MLTTLNTTAVDPDLADGAAARRTAVGIPCAAAYIRTDDAALVAVITAAALSILA